MKIVIVSGYFDPIHVGHLEMFQLAKALGDKLVVIVNNDIQAKIKKGRAFLREEDRLEIIGAIKYVDLPFLSVDDNITVCSSLGVLAKSLRLSYPDCEIVFANGGDRAVGEIPEAKVAKKYNIEMIDGLGEKIRSSSSINEKIEQ
jgi:D-beta-D-heptose 7-phosphate kinase/D-beta-D-heptose 1-phosphate adenosyltransferase